MEKINKFKNKNFIFDGAYCFSKPNIKYCFLLGKNGCSIILEKKLVDSLKLKSIDEELKFKLIQHGLAHLSNVENRICNNCNSKSLYFIIDSTKHCNLNCIYCFRNLNDKRKISKSKLKDVCTYILNVVKSKNIKRINIQMWGGEPLLALDNIEYVVNFFKDTDIIAKIDIETNGTLITDEIAKKLHDWNISIGVSIDGTDKHQNFQRKLVNGQDSMELVKNGIKNLKKYYKDNLGGITVITKYNYNDIVEIIDYYINELGISSMKFNIVKDNPNAKERRLGLTLKEVRKFANKLCDTVELYNLLGIPFSEGNIQIRLDNLLERSNFSCCSSNGCKGGETLISIDINGDVYPCEMMDYKEVKIGSIYENNKIATGDSLEKYINISKNNNIYFKEKNSNKCKSCPWQYYCKGGCTSRIHYLGNKHNIDIVECEFNKTVYPRLIEQILKNVSINSNKKR